MDYQMPFVPKLRESFLIIIRWFAANRAIIWLTIFILALALEEWLATVFAWLVRLVEYEGKIDGGFFTARFHA